MGQRQHELLQIDGDAAGRSRNPRAAAGPPPPYLIQATADAARRSLRRLLPPLSNQALETLAGADVMLSPEQVVRGVIQSDPLLAAQALAAANMLRQRRSPDDRVVDVPGAVEVLGLDGCRTLLETAVATARPMHPMLEGSARRLVAHAMAVAHEARQGARRVGLPSEAAYVGGLLRSLGPALMLVGLSRLIRMPEALSFVLVAGVEPICEHPVAAELARDLVRLWTLPDVLGECIIGAGGAASPPDAGLAVVVARAEATVRDGIGSHLTALSVDETCTGGLDAALHGSSWTVGEA